MYDRDGSGHEQVHRISSAAAPDPLRPSLRWHRALCLPYGLHSAHHLPPFQGPLTHQSPERCYRGMSAGCLQVKKTPQYLIKKKKNLNDLFCYYYFSSRRTACCYLLSNRHLLEVRAPFPFSEASVLVKGVLGAPMLLSLHLTSFADTSGPPCCSSSCTALSLTCPC